MGRKKPPEPGGRKRRAPYSKAEKLWTLKDVEILRLEYRALLKEASRHPEDTPLQKQTEAMRRNWLIAVRTWWKTEQQLLDLKERMPGTTVLYMSRDQLTAVIREANSKPGNTNLTITMKEVINSSGNFKFPVVYSTPTDEGIACEIGMPDGTKKQITISDEEFGKLGKGRIDHPMIEILED